LKFFIDDDITFFLVKLYILLFNIK